MVLLGIGLGSSGYSSLPLDTPTTNTTPSHWRIISDHPPSHPPPHPPIPASFQFRRLFIAPHPSPSTGLPAAGVTKKGWPGMENWGAV